MLYIYSYILPLALVEDGDADVESKLCLVEPAARRPDRAVGVAVTQGDVVTHDEHQQVGGHGRRLLELHPHQALLWA